MDSNNRNRNRNICQKAISRTNRVRFVGAIFVPQNENGIDFGLPAELNALLICHHLIRMAIFVDAFHNIPLFE